MADNDWFAGLGYEKAVAECKQLPNATAEGLDKWCDALDALRDNATVCVVGYADALNGCKEEKLTILDILFRYLMLVKKALKADAPIQHEE